MLITSCVAYLIKWDDEFVNVIFPKTLHLNWDMYIFLITFPLANNRVQFKKCRNRRKILLPMPNEFERIN